LRESASEHSGYGSQVRRRAGGRRKAPRHRMSAGRTRTPSRGQESQTPTCEPEIRASLPGRSEVVTLTRGDAPVPIQSSPRRRKRRRSRTVVHVHLSVTKPSLTLNRATRRYFRVPHQRLELPRRILVILARLEHSLGADRRLVDAIDGARRAPLRALSEVSTGRRGRSRLRPRSYSVELGIRGSRPRLPIHSVLERCVM